MQEIRSAKVPNALAILAGGLSTALGLTVMVGWHTHNTALLQIHPSFVAMVYNTALGFFLCGMALIAIALRRPRLAIIGGVYAVVIGLLNICQHWILQKNLGIDQLFMRHYFVQDFVVEANVYPGRMALSTSVFLPIVGLALLGMVVPRRFRLKPSTVGILGSITFAQGLVAVSSYLSGVISTQAWGSVTRMAVHAAFGFALLGMGLISLAWRDHRAEGRREAPRWRPVVVGVAVAAITLCLWQALVIHNRVQIKRAVEDRTALVRSEIAARIQAHILVVDRMARRWHLSGMKDQLERKSDAAMIVGDYKGFEGIRWVDPSNHIGWTIPSQGHEAEEGMYLALEERRRAALDAARTTRQLAISLPVELTSGGQGFLVLVPLYDGDKFAGYIDGFFRIQHLLDTVLSKEVSTGYAVAVFDGSNEIYRRSESNNQKASEWADTKNLELPGMDWRVEVWPEPTTILLLQSSVSTVTLIGGLLLSLILGWTVWLAQAARARSQIVEDTSLSLRQEVEERKRAEKALREGEERFRTMANNISQFAWMADENGDIFWYNDRWFDYSGTTLEEMAGGGWQKVHHPDHVERVVDKMSKCFQSGEIWEDTFPLRGGDGNYRWFLSRAVPIRDSRGRVLRWFGTNTDVTDSKFMAEELEQARDVALESVRLKSEFLANMSHEIRTPMNGVLGMTGLLLETDLSMPQQEYAETIQSSAEALLTIIDDILDFSKIEAGLLRFEKIDFDLRAAVEGPVELLAERAQGKGLELASHVYGNVPTALKGDPGRLRQVLTNLLGNAVKFTDQGEVVASVTMVSETASHALLRFEIQDSGIGISAEAQSGLFRAFTQADASTTRKYGGTGLGLTISKQLVELMGGEIGIDSNAGAGSTFWFTARFEKQITPAPLNTEPTSNLFGTRVLVVDDNGANRNIIRHQTSSWGMLAVEAESGKQALELLRAGAAQGEPYDMAVLDLMMPDMSGFQLADEIKSDPAIAAVALVLLPSFGNRGDGERAKQSGIAAYLPKPVRQSQLYNCLTAVMGAIDGESVSESQLVTRHSIRESQVHQKAKAFSSLRILIAEDNLVNQRVALGQLSNLGYRAETVSNGRELLEALEHAPVDIILMDCQMPEMDGFEATAEIRLREGTTRHTTIIAMTANALDGDGERCLAAGMDDYLSKPVKSDLLRLMLERWTTPAGKELSEEVLNEGNGSPAERADVIDSSQLASLRDIEGPEHVHFFTDLIDLFLEETESQLKGMHAAHSQNDDKAIRQAAHHLKGSSANVGATQMVVLLGQLEESGRSNGDTETLLGKLDQDFELVRAALTAERHAVPQ